jgi:hypothetical protein
MPSAPSLSLALGPVQFTPQLLGDELRSLGAVTAHGVPLRNPSTRFVPWFDSYAGDVFRRFLLRGSEERGETRVLRLHAESDPDVLFRERRDCSGDPCFRATSWDDAPLVTELDICLAPVEESVDGRIFTGFKYWYEYRGGEVPIHRLVDRQTWEVGGSLDDVTLCLRNWLTPPRMRIGRESVYSTVGLDKWAGLLPGNLWGRWTLLPSFDMQYGAAGVLLGWFDEVSLIRTVVETNAGEDCLRVLDMHLFAQATSVRTNPKTILWSPDVLDETDALNLWTRVFDREKEKACRQLGIPDEGPPAVVFSENVWRGIRFDSTYEEVIDVAAEFGADYVFIDPVWEHQQALKETLDDLVPPERQQGTILEKLWHQNMCVTLDFEVADILGGETGLKALCDRAAGKGVKLISWMATHLSPNTILCQDPTLNHGASGIFAAKESGRHPDTGYAASCWTLNMNGPIAAKVRAQLLGVCERTGLAGFLWDSFCNLGWWQLDYSDGSMRPQYDKMAELYGDLVRAGLYVMPEAVVSFSAHSCCGLHGGNVYAGDLLGYSYNTNIGLESGSSITDIPEDDLKHFEERLITGAIPIDVFFRCLAHKRVPTLHFHSVPREQWHPERVAEIKAALALYQQFRDQMVRRTVLRDGLGVQWEDGQGTRLRFCFKEHAVEGEVKDAVTGEAVTGRLQANRAYLV